MQHSAFPYALPVRYATASGTVATATSASAYLGPIILFFNGERHTPHPLRFKRMRIDRKSSAS